MAAKIKKLRAENRWKGREIAYTITYKTVEPAIKKAMKEIERHTYLRFKKRKRETDFLRFTKGTSCSSTVGRESSGGQRNVNLATKCSWGNAMHEICHALGMYHEHTRRDRNSFVKINSRNLLKLPIDDQSNYAQYLDAEGEDYGKYDFGSIMHYGANKIITAKSLRGKRKGRDYHGDPSDMGQRDCLSDLDIKTIQGLPRGIFQANEVSSSGKISTRSDTRDWSNGWSHMNFIRGRKKTSPVYLLILKSSSGVIHIHRFSSGQVGKRTDKKDWGSGWTSIDSYADSSRAYVVLCRERTGQIHVHPVKSGKLSRASDKKDWSSGYSTMKVFQVKDRNYLFVQKKKDGNTRIYRMLSGGRIGKRVEKYDWSSGWTDAAFYRSGAATYMALLKEGTGKIHIHKMNSDGSVGKRTDTRKWSSGYTAVRFCRFGSKTYILFSKEGTGSVRIYQIKNGKIGALVKAYKLTPGWSDIQYNSSEKYSRHVAFLRKAY